MMFAVPSMGRMGSRGWGRCRGASARTGRNGARVNREWHSPDRVKQSGCTVLPAGIPPGNPIPHSVLSRATQLGVGWHRDYLWQDWDPHACLPPPLVPHLTKVRPCCHEPQGQFSTPSIPCRAKAASASPCASLPQSPSVPRQVPGCDSRSLVEPGHRGHNTLGRRDTLPQRHDPFFCPPSPGCRPQRRWGGRHGHRGSGCAREGLGLGTIPAAAPGHVPAPERVTEGLGEPGNGTVPEPVPGRTSRSSWQPSGARWKTTVHFVLSQAAQRTGEIPNFSSGATVPVTLFRGWQAQAPLCPRGLFTPG